MQHKVLIHDASQQQWLSFSEPQEIFYVDALEKVLPTLKLIEQRVRQHGLWAAGWISYEASPAFDKALVAHKPTEFPLLWFGVFEKCEVVDLNQLVTEDHVSVFQQTVWSLNSNLPDYSKKIHRIKKEIEDGNTYQVNYTIRQYADLDISAQDVFLGFAANARYGAFIDAGRFALCSASPELFFEIKGGKISSRPMKGTAPRGRFVEEDHALRDELYKSQKNRAENLMIVDMIRNDIGRIAESGTVKVPKLFEIEKYPTVWQMTSTVVAQMSDTSLTSIFEALFPCASITGAPKTNTMKIINQLEPSARNIYTGTIGFIRPDMSMQFNVAIRTVLIDKQYNQAEYGVGGGIVWDSTSESEYEECLTKSKVLSGKGTYTHQLLETLLWTPDDGFFLLDYHLARLQQSAEYFDYILDLAQIKIELIDNVKYKQNPQRLRLLVSKSGVTQIEPADFDVSLSSHEFRLKLAHQPVNSNEIYLYHKTTNRSVYNYFWEDRGDYDDVLLINERGELTESCIANLVVEIDGKKFTPPIHCGLLNGTYRQFLLDQGEITERVMTPKDLQLSQCCYLINSVRKMWRVKMEL